jgi:murein tripeptide amidase MpaA
MKISQDFDGGSIIVINSHERENVQLKLATENNSKTTQWFYFKLQTQKNRLHNIRLLNASESQFSSAWREYQVMASYDEKNWFRVKTSYDERELVFTHTPERNSVSYAYFVPYSYLRHQRIIKETIDSKQASLDILGRTIQGNPIELLTFGNPNKAKKKVWFIARQHPGETMAQWFAEGLIERLVNQDSVAKEILKTCVIYIVPNMNLDGSILGNHRTNSKGLDLNRQWHSPTENDCPEVYFVRKKILETGVDIFLDIHGDEKIPYSFIMSSGSACNANHRVDHFKNIYAAANESFQTEIDYSNYLGCLSHCCSVNSCGKKSLSKATDYISQTFDCLSMVLEMPFTQNSKATQGELAPSITTCKGLGFSILEPVLDALSIKSLS